MSTTTYFGDVITTGNTILKQNLTVLGTSYFVSNIVGGQNIGSPGSPFASLSATGSNTTTINAISISTSSKINTSNAVSQNSYQSIDLYAVSSNIYNLFSKSLITSNNIGIGTDASANLSVRGNVWVSNSFQTINVFATSANIGTANIISFSAISNIGIGTGTPANLSVQGSVWVSNSFETTNVFATSANIGTANVGTFETGSIGIGTDASANLSVQGNVWVSNSFQTTNILSTSANIVTANIGSLIATGSIGIGTSTSANLSVQGNLSVSSLLFVSGNIFTDSANVTVSSLRVPYMTVTSNIGVKTNTLANLSVRGNAWISNSFSTTNVLVASANVDEEANVGIFIATGSIGIRTDASANLRVRGNAWVSNSFITPNVLMTSTNIRVATIETFIATRSIGIGTSTSANLTVRGNVWVSNSFETKNISATTMNITGTAFSPVIPTKLQNTSTLTLSSISSGYVGINTSTNLGAALQILGNVYSSNSISSGDLNITNTIVYDEDLTKRSIHLAPSGANAAAIQSWISATCNMSSNSYWSVTQAPVYANAAVSTSGYSGSVLLPDGRVLFVPSTSSSIGFYTPATGEFSAVTPSGFQGPFNGGVLLPTGNVLFAPQTSAVGIYNPVSRNFSAPVNITPGSYYGVLTANNVIFAPQSFPSSIINYNYTTGAATSVLALPTPLFVGQYWANPIVPLEYVDSDVIWTSVAWSSQLGLFVACGFGFGSKSAYSTDGKSWVASTTPLSSVSTSAWQSVAWSPQLGLFVAVAQSFSHSIPSAYSTDGKNWFASTTPLSSNGIDVTFWNSVAWSPELGLFVACGYGYGAGSSSAYSTDGKNWFDSPYNSLGSFAPNTNWLSVAWAPQLGLFVACGSLYVGSSPATSAYSTDGKSWAISTRPLNYVAVTIWNSVAWSPKLGLFVACGIGPQGIASAYSTDGKSWFVSTVQLNSLSTHFTQWYSVAWSPEEGLFVAVGNPIGGDEPGALVSSAYSTDGKTWVASPVQLNNIGYGWNSVAWSPELGLFVVAGYYISAYGMGAVKQVGTCLLPNGNVIVPLPGSSNVIQFDPVSLQASNIFTGTDGFSSLTLDPTGNVIGTPANSNIIVINPNSGTASNVLGSIGGFSGGVLLPSGNVIFISQGYSNIGMFDPIALQYSNSIECGTGFSGGTLLTSGQVVFTPSGSANVGILDTMTPVSAEFCLSPYFNKF